MKKTRLKKLDPNAILAARRANKAKVPVAPDAFYQRPVIIVDDEKRVRIKAVGDDRILYRAKKTPKHKGKGRK